MKRQITIFTFLIIFVSVFSQNPKRERYIDEIILPTTYLDKDISSLLNSGYRGFIIDAASDINESYINGLENFLEANPKEFIGIIQKGTDHYQGDYLYSYFIKRTIDFDREYLPLCDSLFKYGKQILFFSDKTEELMLPSEDYLVYAEVGKRFPHIPGYIFAKNESTNLFTLFWFNESLAIDNSDSLFINNNLRSAAINYIRKTGKIPNFIITDNPTEIQNLSAQLPFYVKLSMVDNDGTQLRGVAFKEIEHLKTEGITHLIADQVEFDSANFSRDNIELTPVKKGYRFLPEIFTFNYNNFNQFKTFIAQRIDLRNDLQFFFPFTEKELFKEDYQADIVDSNIEIIKNSDLKSVGLFDGHSSGIHLSRDDINDLEVSFSILLWAKPYNVDGNFPFFSKPGSYCMKIRHGSLCLTIVDIEDLVSSKTTINVDEWQHIGVVFEKDQNISFYLNGVLTDIIPAIDYPVVESGYIIGTDQWDEYYEGEMSELLVWNRPLGADEIIDVYENGIVDEEGSSLLNRWSFRLLLGILVVIAVAVLWWKRRRKDASEDTKGPTWITQKIDEGELKNYIRYFGEFAIFDNEGVNLGEKLSSKKRSLLMVVLYHTITADGISPQKLADTFWPGYNSLRAKNVRGTYIQDIRTVFPEDMLSIVYESSRWKILLNSEFHCDLANLLAIEKSFSSSKRNGQEADKKAVETYVNILKNGTFADGFSNEYIDPVKEEVHDRIMENLEEILDQYREKSDNELTLNVIGTILKLDPVHEEVFKQKMEILIQQGDRYGAQKCFDRFICAWENFFGEPYNLKFEDFNGK